ncbi:RagB/SusD family nutrient uptake outer membrane protein [Niabella ginsengisoli]|uniref:RagB/SusD family nutrient uptake outer membrane protein n=1 Tax=Niabella ginsengisoli TaxID=522298 RepID=A0ABS9SN79_9BACT|nr:RagB/SusD family nutrient uptake outer membrane protein [Niabella ginsengisoli]MCH5599800.1 RagB/SusD family nutrient uptake outer membrane protein [Niabella ginsengisoli]
MQQVNIIKKLIAALLIISIALPSCDLDRLPLNGPSTETFPASEKEATMGLFAAYQSISQLDAASTPMWHVMDNITDIGYARPGNNYTSPITSALTTDNALAVKPWQVHYKTIARCHAVLDKLPGLKNEISETVYNQLDAELRFIRAYCYSQLIELYGAVPLITQAVGLGNSNVERTPKAAIEQFILDELTEIAERLPVSQGTYGNVRASKVAAYMLKARVALYSKNTR